MNQYHLAQINIAHARAAMDSSVMAGFARRLEEINAIADTSPGFVWRLQTEDGDATSIQAFDDPMLLVNVSVWGRYSVAEEFCLQIHPCRTYTGPGRLVQQNGRRAPGAMVGSSGAYSNACRSPRKNRAVTARWPRPGCVHIRAAVRSRLEPTDADTEEFFRSMA